MAGSVEQPWNELSQSATWQGAGTRGAVCWVTPMGTEAAETLGRQRDAMLTAASPTRGHEQKDRALAHPGTILPPRGWLSEKLPEADRGLSGRNSLHAAGRSRIWEKRDFSKRHLVPGSGSCDGLSCISPKLTCRSPSPHYPDCDLIQT